MLCVVHRSRPEDVGQFQLIKYWIHVIPSARTFSMVKCLDTSMAMPEHVSLCALCWLQEHECCSSWGGNFCPKVTPWKVLSRSELVGWVGTWLLGCVVWLWCFWSSALTLKPNFSHLAELQPKSPWCLKFGNVVPGLCAWQTAGLSLSLSKQNHDLLSSWSHPSHGSWLWDGWDNHIPLVWSQILEDRVGWSMF